MINIIHEPKEFLAVRHSVLNGNTYDVGELVDDTLKLGRYAPERHIVPCFEGDLIQVRETGEIVLTHQNLFPLSQAHYKKLKEEKIAASLREVLDKIAEYKARNSQRVVLCFEPKHMTSTATIDETVRILKEYGITDVYFDSFIGDKLDAVHDANLEHETAYGRSLHLIGNIGSIQLMTTEPKETSDICTVPYPMSFGELGQPVIYGAVGSPAVLERLAEQSNCVGVYVRLKEGAGIRGLVTKTWNSVTNTRRLRETHIAKYSYAP